MDRQVVNTNLFEFNCKTSNVMYYICVIIFSFIYLSTMFNTFEFLQVRVKGLILKPKVMHTDFFNPNNNFNWIHCRYLV